MLASGLITQLPNPALDIESLDEPVADAMKARTLEGIRQGLEDMKAGRGRPADEVFADIRREFNLAKD